MENELELQIQRVEERAKREINDRLRDEYDMKIKKKEEEIADIQAQIRSLRMHMGGSDVDGSDVPDSTTMDRVTTDLNLLVMSPSYRQRALTRLSSHLVPDLPLLEVMAKLESTELELASLKEQLAEQEKRLHFNTLDHLDETKMCTHFQSPRNSSSLRSGAQSLGSMELNPVTPQPPERMFKVILVGDTGVGKSSFMHQFCDGVFYPRLRATVGVDFRTRNLRVDQKVYSIQLWDTAGQEKYRSIVRTYFRKVDGVIVVYDVTAPSTFRNVRSWMEQIYSISSHPNVPVIIVGNKIDLRLESQSSMVTTEVGQNLAESYNALFIETSIPTAENVDETVRMLANAMKLNEDTQLASVQLTPSPTKPTRSCCKS
ncbi:unnamed protein product [Dicrocoelium dendriticum]|nr:unnamed protein product [Dicrocoelium dendriticum]